MTPGETPAGVGDTAIGAAMMRAREHERPDALFRDPFAGAFVSAAPPIFEDAPDLAGDPALGDLEAAFEEAVVLRTRFFDDLALGATASGCRQVVLVGAGLDARAFRLDWPAGTGVFELDSPGVLEFKDRVLGELGARPRCPRMLLGVDLATPSWLAELATAGFDTRSKSVWLVEGVIPYLTAEQAQGLLLGISDAAANGSRLAFDHPGEPSHDPLDRARSMPPMEHISRLWKGGLAGDPVAVLGRLGWVAEVIGGERLRQRYRRRRRSDLVGSLVAAVRAGRHAGGSS